MVHMSRAGNFDLSDDLSALSSALFRRMCVCVHVCACVCVCSPSPCIIPRNRHGFCRECESLDLLCESLDLLFESLRLSALVVLPLVPYLFSHP